MYTALAISQKFYMLYFHFPSVPKIYNFPFDSFLPDVLFRNVF